MNEALLMTPQRDHQKFYSNPFKFFNPGETLLDQMFDELVMYWDAMLAEIPELKSPPERMRSHDAHEDCVRQALRLRSVLAHRSRVLCQGGSPPPEPFPAGLRQPAIGRSTRMHPSLLEGRLESARGAMAGPSNNPRSERILEDAQRRPKRGHTRRRGHSPCSSRESTSYLQTLSKNSKPTGTRC